MLIFKGIYLNDFQEKHNLINPDKIPAMLGLPYQGCRNPNIYEMVAERYK